MKSNKHIFSKIIGVFFTFLIAFVMPILVSASAETRIVNRNWDKVDSDSSQIIYDGTWSVANEGGCSGGNAKQTNTVGSSASFTFTGTGVRLIGQTDSNFGDVDVYIDGDYMATVSAKTNTNLYQQNIYTLVGLPSGEHTFKVVASNGYIEVDAMAFTTDTSDVVADIINTSTDKIRLNVDKTLKFTSSAMEGSSYIYSDKVSVVIEDTAIASYDKGIITAKKLGSTKVIVTMGELRKEIPLDVVVKPAMRRVIDNENPLLVFPIYAKSFSNTTGAVCSWGDSLLGRWNSIPSDVQKNAIIEIHAGSQIGLNETDSHTAKAFYENQLDIAQENNIPVMIVVATAGQKNYWTGCANLDDAWIDSMFAKYDCLQGIMSTENYWTDYNVVANRGKGYLEIAAKYGGFFMWSEHQTNVIESVIGNASFNAALQEYDDHFIFTWKNTPAREDKNPGTASYMQGLWLSDMAAQWGGLMDTWKWYELNYWKLFAGKINDTSLGGYISGGEEARPVVTQPEALLAIEMLGIYNNGGVVYNFEHPAYTFGVNDLNSPCLDNAILEAFRFIMNNPAPSKDEIIKETKAILHGNMSRFSRSSFYNGLNCEDGTGGTYSSGRYGLIPTVPASVPKSMIQNNFSNEQIISSTDPRLADASSRKAFFNGLYEREYEGTGFVQKNGERYTFYNSLVNTNTTQEVSIPFADEKSVKIKMEPHTFGFIKEEEDSLFVYMNNYRVDKDDVWEGYKVTETGRWDTDHNQRLEEWMVSTYIPNPADDKFRTTTFTISNLQEEPRFEVTRKLQGQASEPVVQYNEATKQAIITVDMNGYIEFKVLYQEKVPVIVDKSVLEAKMKEVESLDEALYTPDTWSQLKTKLLEANNVVKNAVATQEEVDAILVQLTKAVDELKKIETSSLNGWVKDAIGWKYYKDNNAIKSSWIKLIDKWYYLKTDGYMAIGWQEVDDKWYYLKANGAMITGWLQESNKWYYMKSDGAMAINWVADNGTWYFMKANGAMATGWVLDKGTWYFMKANGAMATGWVLDKGIWYFMKANGAMATGWVLDKNSWYFMKANGSMATGWTFDGIKEYYLDRQSGAWSGLTR